MKIICGYTTDGFKPQARDAIAKFAPDCELLDFTGDDFAYARAIVGRWTGTEDLVIIEHDNVIHKDVIPSFVNCREPWCTYSYPCVWDRKLQRLTWGLGCVKFSAELQRKAPMGPLGVNRRLLPTNISYPVYWAAVDGMVHDYLTASGFSPHVHGAIEHLHNYNDIMVPHPTSFGWSFLNKLGGAEGV